MISILIKAYLHNETQMYADELPYFEDGSPFGHLEVKYEFILTRLNLLNERIKEIHLCHETILDKTKAHEYVSREESLRPLAFGLLFASDLKILTDELISLNYLLYQQHKTKIWPIEVKIDCIGEFLKLKDKSGFDAFNNNIKTVETINHIGNAIKHSFVNSQVLWKRNLGAVPKLFAFYNHRNHLNNGVNFYEIEFPELISNYNLILDDYRSEILKKYMKNWSLH